MPIYFVVLLSSTSFTVYIVVVFKCIVQLFLLCLDNEQSWLKEKKKKNDECYRVDVVRESKLLTVTTRRQLIKLFHFYGLVGNKESRNDWSSILSHQPSSTVHVVSTLSWKFFLHTYWWFLLFIYDSNEYKIIFLCKRLNSTS